MSPFNRTIVELKRDEFGVFSRVAVAFNRTIVELKQCLVPMANWIQVAFNRTIVELKRWQVTVSRCNFRLLIEPLWN